MLPCLINPRVRKSRNEACSCPGIFNKLFAFILSLAPPFHPSPISLTDTENLISVAEKMRLKISSQFSSGKAHFITVLFWKGSFITILYWTGSFEKKCELTIHDSGPSSLSTAIKSDNFSNLVDTAKYVLGTGILIAKEDRERLPRLF